mgnify:CR=1 FL=1
MRRRSVRMISGGEIPWAYRLRRTGLPPLPLCERVTEGPPSPPTPLPPRGGFRPTDFIRTRRRTWLIAAFAAGVAVGCGPTRPSGDADPRAAFRLVQAGREKARYGDLDGAAADYDTALAAEPGNLWALQARGELRLAGKPPDFDGAQADFDAVLRRDRYRADALAGRARARSQRPEGADVAGAIDDFTAALQYEPGRPDLRQERARLRLRAADAYASVGMDAERRRQLQAALADLDLAMLRQPDLPGLREDYARTLIDLGIRLEQAEAALRKALAATEDGEAVKRIFARLRTVAAELERRRKADGKYREVPE